METLPPPDAPDYMLQASKLLAEYPLAQLDPRVKSTVDSYEKVFNLADEQRKKDQDRQFQLENAAINREESATIRREDRIDTEVREQKDWETKRNIVTEENVAGLSAKGQDAYDAAIKAGKPIRDAWREANRAAQTEYTPREAAAASQAILKIDDMVAELTAKLNDPVATALLSEEDKAQAKAQIDRLNGMRQDQEEVYNTYRATKAGEGKGGAPADKPAATVAPVSSILPKN
jgi:hypothetical protein